MNKNSKMKNNKQVIFFQKINNKINYFFEKKAKIYFIDKYFKIIVSIIIFISLFFMIRLFWYTWEFSFWCLGGFINLCLEPEVSYYFSFNTILSIFLVIFLFFIYYLVIKKEKVSNWVKLKYIIFLLILSLFSKQIFNIVSPKVSFMYWNNKTIYNNVVTRKFDVHKYIYLINKYCKEWINIREYCNNKYINEFSSAEEYIYVFEKSMKNNLDYVYFLTVVWLGFSPYLDEVLNEYGNDILYAYLIEKFWDKDEIIDFLEDKIINMELILLLEKVKEFKLEFNKLKKVWNEGEIFNFKNNIDLKIKKELESIEYFKNNLIF